MRQSIPGGARVFLALILASLLVQLPAQSDGAAPRRKKAEPPPPKIEETVGDLAYVLQNGEIKVEGVGLVAGLENTGADPPPSWYRNQLVDEMSKAGVEKASKLLGNPQFSMVIVKMTIPAGASPEDRLDVEVEVPPACGTRSLSGGYLMATRLREVLVAGGTPRTGSDMAFAQGPVMIGNAKDPKNPKVGRVLGGGRVKKESPYTMVINEKRRSVRTAAILEKVINERFHQSESGQQKGAATAKTDSFLTLKVPTTYHQNQERFFRVVQLLPMVDTPALRAKRMAVWGKELLDPKASGVAALRLEGLGPSAAETLAAGLKSDNAQVRFFAAEGLAYLDDPAGAEALAQTAVSQPKFRAYALAALAAMDQPASHAHLRKLMDEPEMEVRYGAFNALRTLDPHDPSLGRVRVLDLPPENEDSSEEAPDSMAMAIAWRSKRPHAEDPFALYMVDSEGPPVVHVSRTRRSEIVVFGQTQKLLPPVVLGSGEILLNAAETDDEIEISKIVPSKFGDSDMKIRSSLDLGDVIRRVANLGATYPELVSILEAANRQKNLAGTLVVDAVPSSNMDYLPAVLGRDGTDKDDRDEKTSETSLLRRLFSWRRRDESKGSTTSPKVEPSGKRSTDPAHVDSGGDELAATPKRVGATDSDSLAKKDATGAESPSEAPKKDEGLQKAGAEEPIRSPSSPRLFNLFRRRSD
jgi:flagellar basal body P-ring protein FlgI